MILNNLFALYRVLMSKHRLCNVHTHVDLSHDMKDNFHDSFYIVLIFHLETSPYHMLIYTNHLKARTKVDTCDKFSGHISSNLYQDIDHIYYQVYNQTFHRDMLKGNDHLVIIPWSLNILHISTDC